MSKTFIHKGKGYSKRNLFNNYFGKKITRIKSIKKYMRHCQRHNADKGLSKATKLSIKEKIADKEMELELTNKSKYIKAFGNYPGQLIHAFCDLRRSLKAGIECVLVTDNANEKQYLYEYFIGEKLFLKEIEGKSKYYLASLTPFDD